MKLTNSDIKSANVALQYLSNKETKDWVAIVENTVELKALVDKVDAFLLPIAKKHKMLDQKGQIDFSDPIKFSKFEADTLDFMNKTNEVKGLKKLNIKLLEGTSLAPNIMIELKRIGLI